MSLKNVYDILKKVNSTSSRNEKEKIIEKEKGAANFETVVHYAYDYKKKYNVTKVEYLGQNKNNELKDLFDYLDYLSSKNGATDEEKDKLSSLSSIDQETSEIVNMIINKDLRCGASIKTFKKIFKDIPVFGVMLCEKNITKFLKYNKNKSYYWSRKVDGVRVINKVFKDHVEWHLSRNGKEYPNFSIFDNELILLANAINKDFPHTNFPYLIDGEAMSEGGQFNNIMSQIRRLEDIDVSLFRLCVFDLQIDQSFENRYNILDYEFLKNDFTLLSLIEHRKCGIFDEKAIKELSEHVVKYGVKGIDEGIVIKIADSIYENKKSKYWCKVKPTETVDLNVIRFEYGKGKYEDAVGKLIVDFNGVEVGVGSGMSDEQRYEFLNELPKIIEVEYKEITPDGSLREPIFKRVREDKDETD